jgi:hypothetical protein
MIENLASLDQRIQYTTQNAAWHHYKPYNKYLQGSCEHWRFYRLNSTWGPWALRAWARVACSLYDNNLSLEEYEQYFIHKTSKFQEENNKFI